MQLLFMLKSHLPVQIETNWTIHICILPIDPYQNRMWSELLHYGFIGSSFNTLLLNSYQKFLQSRSQIFASWTQDTANYLHPSIWWLEMVIHLSLLYGSWWDMMIFYFLWTGMKHFLLFQMNFATYLSQFFETFFTYWNNFIV